uniref:ABC transporter domain-containing protein n=1 Tax=Entomoneis paludosa TaxID=265537 RepID=A0A7S2YIL3_9STRA
MGGSGSGKTTLLNVLSGRLTTNSRKKIHVEMDKYTFDSKVINPGSSAVQKYIAYAEQEDKLIATATVKEALVFSARLRLPREFTDQDIENIALSLMEDLQLSHRADSLIGGPRKRGISGGEKRRMSLALELVTRPTTLFLDEITSGLDSFSASVVMELCKKLTRGSKTMGGSQVFNAYEGWDNRLPTTILMTIHQPSSILFEMIDDIIILQKGRAVYQGPSGRAAMDFFEERGYALPAQYNPAVRSILIMRSRPVIYVACSDLTSGIISLLCRIGSLKLHKRTTLIN